MGRTMKHHLLPLLDKLLLRKRSSIETLFAKLKWGMGWERGGHRAPINAFVPILSCLAAYSLAQPKATWAYSTFLIPLELIHN